MFKKTNFFTLLTKFLVIILPFYVILKVFFVDKLHILFFGILIKEFIILLLIISLFYYKIKNKIKFKFDILDYLIFSYIGYGIIITIYNGLGFNSLFYGGRYDFIFFIVFLIYKHSTNILKISLDKLIKLFLISGSISVFLGLIVKYVTGEEILLKFGYVNYVSNWTYNGGIPIYHGLASSGIRRFQGILESPNSMAFFLILFGGLFLHKNRKNLVYHIILVCIFIFILILITYSRSALLGILFAISIIFIINIKSIYKKYKKETILTIIFVLLISSGTAFLFQNKLHSIFLRDGSTKGHFDRMKIGIERFENHKLLGEGLGTSGPAYRNIYTNEQISKQVEAYFIPESWFIQQLIEGGIIYFSIFITILSVILLQTYKKSKPMFGMLIAILVMNLFLHSFESTYNSILLFLFLGILLKNKLKIKASN